MTKTLNGKYPLPRARRHFLFLAVAVLVPICLAFGQERLDPAKFDCDGWMEKDLGLGQSGMNVCARRDASVAQEKLRQLLEELHRKFIADGKNAGTQESAQWQRLRQAQKIWELFVEQDCRWETGFFEGGTIQPMVEALYVVKQTEQRINRLRVFLCEGEGMTGECPRSRPYITRGDEGR